MRKIQEILARYKGGILDGANNKYYGWQRLIQS